MMNSRSILFAFSLLTILSCGKKVTSNVPPEPPITPPATGTPVDMWLTRGDKSALLQGYPAAMHFNSTMNGYTDISVDSTSTFQTVDGFGYTLTGGSAQVINGMGATEREALLQELFGAGVTGRNISYLRISIGASDLNATPFTYDEPSDGGPDTLFTAFSLEKDQAGGTGLIPLLKRIIAIHPGLKILGSPWTAPVWMKDNKNYKGGSLRPEYYGTYAKFFVRYIQAMQAEGITIDAITPQNEPMNPDNTPSLYMTAEQQRDFIKTALGPAFRAAGLATKIIVWDHNCDLPQYPETILNDAGAKQYVDGSAFHLYNGDISALSRVHDLHPDRSVYFTEQWTSSKGDFGGDLNWHVRNVIVGSMRNWSRVALEWNLANDPNFEPHTPGGCTECKGALTIGGSTVTRNVSYYIVAHASSFVPAGSVRIASTQSGSLSTVAFQTPSGGKVLIVGNDGGAAASFNILFNGKRATATLPASSVATYVW